MKFLYKKSILLLIIGIVSCSKTKVDERRDPPFDNSNIKYSTARIMMVNGMDVEINNTKITNWQGQRAVGTPEIPPFPTRYFPTSGKPGLSFFVPQEFMSAKNNAMVKLYLPGGGATIATVQAEDNYSTPWDYYLNMHAEPLNYTYRLTPVSRPVTKPMSPQNILIRLVNLSSKNVANYSEGETLSLAYSNGEKVSTITSGIAAGSSSKYVEIPYGTYDFHVFASGENFKQYAAVPPQVSAITSLSDFTILNTKLYFSQRRIFQPGGVYTIIVSAYAGKFQLGDVNVPLNLFSCVADLQLDANLTYGRVQVANAAIKNGIIVSINSSNEMQVSYGTASKYQTLVAGSQNIEIKDNTGKVLANKTISLKGGDNFTIWTYPNKDGTLAITLAQNNMSGIASSIANPDGADGSVSVGDPLKTNTMTIQTRFLNFCPEIQSVSFTGQNGQSLQFSSGETVYPPAATNLKIGEIPDGTTVPSPYVNLNLGVIEAYESELSSVPGKRLVGVVPINAKMFINMPSESYPNGLPAGEPGVYTVALIGHYNNVEQPKMIVLKHNQ